MKDFERRLGLADAKLTEAQEQCEELSVENDRLKGEIIALKREQIEKKSQTKTLGILNIFSGKKAKVRYTIVGFSIILIIFTEYYLKNSEPTKPAPILELKKMQERLNAVQKRIEKLSMG